MKLNSGERLADDLLKGIPAIAEYTGLRDRELYHLASAGKLRGVFKIGAIYYGRKSEIDAGFSSKAKA